MNPGSISQLELQPSPFMVFPSSHCSAPSTTPLPQVAPPVELLLAEDEVAEEDAEAVVDADDEETVVEPEVAVVETADVVVVLACEDVADVPLVDPCPAPPPFPLVV